MDPIVVVGEAQAGRQQTVRRTLIKLSEDINRTTFDCAELLYEVQDKKYYLDWRFESLGDYAATELNLKARKSQYLARVIRVMRECGIKRADFEGCGITKLRVISSLEPSGTFFNSVSKEHESLVDHIVDLTASAPELSVQEIEERVAHLKGLDGENSILTRSYNVTRSAYEGTIKPALEVMRRLLGSRGRDESGKAVEYSDGQCLEYICREFLNDPNNFLEEPDESQVQIDVQEEVNYAGRTLDKLVGTEERQDALPTPRQVVATE